MTTADVKITSRVLYRGRVIDPGVHLAGIPVADGEMLEAIGVGVVYRG